MKKAILLIITVLSIISTADAQRSGLHEKYGKTFNMGLGIGYYGYAEQSMPVIHFNYEFDVAKDFTLAPFITFYSYRQNRYHQTVVPIGVKGTYYFDRLVKADSKWDFYLAGSLGFAIINTKWDDGYEGKLSHNEGAGPLYLDLHIGTEYHFNNKIGAFLDLSTGVSTIGISIH